jgi:hypothetical protein
MLSLQFMQNIAASLSCIAELYCMFLGLASVFIRETTQINQRKPYAIADCNENYSSRNFSG